MLIIIPCIQTSAYFDAICRPADLINKAIEFGLTGIAITDHECLSAHMEVNEIAEKLRETNPNFTIALGNEIYLTDTRENGQRYYHFILLAKDALGHKALRELSSKAWYNLYVDKGLERVPTLKSELEEIVNKYPGHLIATSACIGGELPQAIINLSKAKDWEEAKKYSQEITDFISYCKNLFHDDFYIECAPSSRTEQIWANQHLKNAADIFGIKMTVGTDTHYLTEKDRWVHKSYLNSKGGEREVDSFYEFARLMTPEECHSLLEYSFDKDFVDEIFGNTQEIQSKISFYSFARKQIIPKVEVKDYQKYTYLLDREKFPILDSLINSDNEQERYWANECLIALNDKGFGENQLYLERLETEANIIKAIGEHLNDCLFAYFNTFKHYIHLFWECGSIVGPGRGSATGFLSNYLLGITQLDPIRWELKYWRFLNLERIELPDIDIDLAPSKREAIFQAIRAERGEFGLVQVATFGTEGGRSAIQTACRGYRTTDYPDGIDTDEAQYMSSLIPQERGFLWPIQDVVNGNLDKDRKPITQFINEVNKYPGLLEIITSIEGIINKRSSHASGVILYDGDPFETAAFMRTPGGDLITCYDLHRAERAGDTKYDLLLTEASDKIIACYELLKKYREIPDLTLKEFYDKYLHPEVMDVKDTRLWDHLAQGDVLDCFQFSTSVGLQIAKKLKPKNPMEMVAANAMMRLMSEKGQESQQDRYYRIQQNGIDVFDREMKQHNVPTSMRLKLHHHCDPYYGCCPLQEQMMEILMDIADFTLGEANAARKIVAKKQMSKIPELREQVFAKFDQQDQAEYFWQLVVAPQLGYAFSINHSLPYSFVALQMIYLAINYDPIYWDTACLIVNSGSLEATSGASTDYKKIAKAIGDIQSAGIKVSLANINQSDFGFSPDKNNQQILFGLKGILNVGEDVIADTIANRPYSSPRDYLNKVSPKRSAMIALIKSGAFDSMMDRKLCLGWYIWETCDRKKNLTLQNLNGLMTHHLLPEETDEQLMARRIYEFTRYLKAICLTKGNDYYVLDDRAIAFLTEIGKLDLVKSDRTLSVKVWDSVYQTWMDVYRKWIASAKEEILQKLNTEIFKEDWEKYAGENANLSAWEMEVLCFYYHEHELAHINKSKYGIIDFKNLCPTPTVAKTFEKGGHTINIYNLYKICGTCIAKDKLHSSISLLTTDGVVEVKFAKTYFPLFDKQISCKKPNGTKKVVEKSWFTRGSMLVVQGIRTGDSFMSKNYASSGSHQLYKITSIEPDGDIILTSERAQGELEDATD